MALASQQRAVARELATARHPSVLSLLTESTPEGEWSTMRTVRSSEQAARSKQLANRVAVRLRQFDLVSGETSGTDGRSDRRQRWPTSPLSS